MKCGNGHEFESWFNNSSKCDELMKKKLVECPVCGDTNCTKALMAPNIPKKGRAPKSDYAQAREDRQLAKEWADKNCVDVGENFADEVRAMHYGDKENRNVQGITTEEEASKLRDEGIEIINLGPKISKQ